MTLFLRLPKGCPEACLSFVIAQKVLFGEGASRFMESNQASGPLRPVGTG